MCGFTFVVIASSFASSSASSSRLSCVVVYFRVGLLSQIVGFKSSRRRLAVVVVKVVVVRRPVVVVVVYSSSLTLRCPRSSRHRVIVLRGLVFSRRFREMAADKLFEPCNDITERFPGLSGLLLHEVVMKSYRVRAFLLLMLSVSSGHLRNFSPPTLHQL